MAQFSTGSALHSTVEHSTLYSLHCIVYSTTEHRREGTPLLTQSDSKLPRVETLQSGEHNNYHHPNRFHRHLLFNSII